MHNARMLARSEDLATGAGVSALTRETSLARRLYFLVGDLLGNPGVSALVALSVSVLVADAWYVATGMVVGMALGIVVAVVCLILLTPIFGAFEVMLPGMTGAMAMGMIVGMQAAMTPVDPGRGAGLGAVIGLAVLIVVRLFDRHIRHQEASWTS